MNVNLLGPNLLLILCFVITSLITFLLFKRLTSRKKKQHWGQKQLVIWLCSGIILSTVIEIFFTLIYSGQELPFFIIDAAPLTLSLVYILMTFRNNELLYRVLSIVLFLVSTVFTLLLVNNYFQYYPTLYAALNINDYKHISSSQQASVTFRYDPQLDKINQGNLLETDTQLNTTGLPSTGQVFTLQIPGKVSGFKARPTYIYAPPIAFSPLKLDLPVVVLLPGTPGSPDDWLNGGNVMTTMNKFAAHHNGITPLVVMTDEDGSFSNDTECVNSYRGNAETYLTVDVPNYIKTHFDVSDKPANWAIGGLSDGGMCGIMLTLLHPNIYHYFLDFGGELGPQFGSASQTTQVLFHGSESAYNNHQPANLLETKQFPGVGGFFAVGKSDSYQIQDAVRQLYDESIADKLNVVYESINGQHTFATWAQSFEDALPWLSNQLGATSCASSCY